MVYYFSGTGNSQMAAKQIGKAIGDKVVSINELLRAGDKTVQYAERPLVFVTPTYCWRMPRVVTEWIQETRFKGNPNAYFVLTCGDDCGNAALYAKRLCGRKGFVYRGLAAVVMPENYVALFPTPNQATAADILEKARPCIAALARQVNEGEELSAPSSTLGGKLRSGPVNPLFYWFTVKDRAFSATDSCIGCGLCAKRCPLRNIVMESARPRWQGNCTHCMACIGGCPAKAIEYGKKSKGQPRYFIAD